ncbi:hypothetical protein JNUCC64_13370 [Streptomyces sp. JNUCC 64]
MTTRTDRTHGTDPEPPPHPSRADRGTTRAAARAAARWSPRRIRLIGALLVLTALLPALACYFVFAHWLPSDVERYRAHSSAGACPADTTAGAPEDADCLRTLTFTVRGVDASVQNRSDSYEATLRRAGTASGDAGDTVVTFGDPAPLLQRLRPGDRVSGTVWRGEVTALSRDGVRQATSAEPRDDPQVIAALGTLAGLLAALGLGFGTVRLARPARPEPFVWRGYGRPLFFLTLILCAATGFLAFGVGLPWWTVPSATVPAVGYTAWEFHRYRLRSAADGPSPAGLS